MTKNDGCHVVAFHIVQEQTREHKWITSIQI
jgi:hypothetical protein